VSLPPYPKWTLPPIRRAIERLDKTDATDIQLNLTIVQLQHDNSFEYRVNNQPHWKAKSIPAGIGETQLWTVRNETPWSHPLHLHGFFFQVLDKDGEHARPLEWKDTVDVPFKNSVRLLVRYDDRPGTWMVHCHILDHAEGGLMTTVQLGDSGGEGHTHHKDASKEE
jgi:FtsP/CotA-like multicopper oxidase with cupredoxin domain